MNRRARDGGGASAFEVRRARGVWQVVRDGAFYGDFPVRQSAMDAANAAARLPLTRATPARICVRDDGGALASAPAAARGLRLG